MVKAPGPAIETRLPPFNKAGKARSGKGTASACGRAREAPAWSRKLGHNRPITA